MTSRARRKSVQRGLIAVLAVATTSGSAQPAAAQGLPERFLPELFLPDNADLLSVRTGPDRLSASFSQGCWTEPVPGGLPQTVCLNADYSNPTPGSFIPVSAKNHLLFRSGRPAAGIEVIYTSGKGRYVRKGKPVATAGRLWTAKLPPADGRTRYVTIDVDYRYAMDGVTFGGVLHFFLGDIRRTPDGSR